MMMPKFYLTPEEKTWERWACPFCGAKISVESAEQIENRASEHLQAHCRDESDDDVEVALDDLQNWIDDYKEMWLGKYDPNAEL